VEWWQIWDAVATLVNGTGVRGDNVGQFVELESGMTYGRVKQVVVSKRDECVDVQNVMRPAVTSNNDCHV